MRTFFITLMVSLCMFSSAVAEEGTPTPTPTPAATKTLTCTKTGKGNIIFGICGINGCPSSITANRRTTKYNFTRSKASDGSLTYETGSRTTGSQCIIKIGSLRRGFRKTTQVSCATALVGANCFFSK